jgi:hypothetical protein
MRMKCRRYPPTGRKSNAADKLFQTRIRRFCAIPYTDVFAEWRRQSIRGLPIIRRRERIRDRDHIYPRGVNSEKKARLLKHETRHWSSGYVRLCVIGIDGHPEDNYIVLEKRHTANLPHPDQRFNLRERDWKALKRMIDGDLAQKGLAAEAQWSPPVISDEDLARLVGTRPELLETLLNAPNLVQLSEPSLQSLDRIADEISDIKRTQLELIFERLAAAPERGIEQFAGLLRDLQLEQIASLARLVNHKLKTLDVLEKVATDPSRREREVHRIFDLNPWLLGKGFEIIYSDRTLATYLQQEVSEDPKTRKRPDLIVKRTPHTADILLVELKAPGVPLAAEHVGQVLGYKGLIERYRPNVGEIHCFVLGYEKDTTFTPSRDAMMKTFSELINELRDEYAEFAAALEAQHAEEPPPLAEAA